MDQYFLIYLIVINLIAFVFWGYDKWQAVRKHTRISEKRLLLLAVIGGSVGGLLGMQVFRHKTQKSSFLWKMMGVLLLHIAIIVVFLAQ